MTCISAVVKNGHVYMAGDLMGSNGFTKKVYPDTKVFKNGDFLIGYTSSFRMGQILQYNWSQPSRLEGVTDREYLQIDVIESMRECFNTYGFGEFKDGEHQGGTFLIGYKGELYEMQSNFSILKNENFAAVGSGQYHAESTLLLLTQDPDFDPQEVLTASIYAASYFTTSVSEDCTIVTTDEDYEKELDSRYYIVGDNPEMVEKEPTTVVKIPELTFDKGYFDKTTDEHIMLLSLFKSIALDNNVEFAHNIGIKKLHERVKDFIEIV